MQPFIETLKKNFENDIDFVILKAYVGKIPVTVAGYRSLVDLPQTLMMLSFTGQQIDAEDHLSVTGFLNGMGNILELDGHDSVQQATKCILLGMLVLFHEPSGTCACLSSVVSKNLSRPIGQPYTENILRGSISAFTEDFETNLGVLRKYLVNPALQIQLYSLGVQTSRRLGIAYLENEIDVTFLKKIQDHIENNLQAEIASVQMLARMLGLSDNSLFTRFNSTELPQSAATALQEGKIVIFLDRFPFALIVPSLLSDMYAICDDTNFPHNFMVFLRMLRVIGILITLLMPGLYVALVSVNPEVLRIELALSVAKSRIDVPYPAFVEALLLLIVLELILEASVRLPKSIGPTVTMVGGIILGEAVVSAKLVSNLLIIILAATTIASSTVSGYQNSVSLRLLKYVILVLCTIFGVLGLVAGIVIIAAYLTNIETFGVPYFQIRRSKGGQHG